MAEPVIAIVMPCYNDSEVLPLSVGRLSGILDTLVAAGKISPQSFMLCVNDGSTDGTWQLINKFHKSDPRVKGVALAHNRGQQCALMAGLMTVNGKCDAAITIDADLQDDPAVIGEMVEMFRDGKDIVYGVRKSRAIDSWFKRTSAHAFYRLQRSLGMNTIYDHADYRLMSDRAIGLLSEYGEANLFLRGIIPQIGLDSGVVAYDRQKRAAGESNYSLTKMISFSIDGVTSFSAKPIRMIFFVGLALLLLDIIVALYVFTSYFSDRTILGWTSLMLSVWFLGSIILMSIGVVGEYIGKIFSEVKHRPRYAIRDTLWD